MIYNDLHIGDIIEVKFFISLKDKKIQKFIGILISKKKKCQSFTLRKNSFGEGVEYTFKFDSPKILEVELISKNFFRKSKLYFLRNKMYHDKKIFSKY